MFIHIHIYIYIYIYIDRCIHLCKFGAQSYHMAVRQILPASVKETTLLQKITNYFRCCIESLPKQIVFAAEHPISVASNHMCCYRRSQSQLCLLLHTRQTTVCQNHRSRTAIVRTEMKLARFSCSPGPEARRRPRVSAHRNRNDG